MIQGALRAASVLAATAAACGGGGDGRTPVVLWHSYGGAERAALEATGAAFNAEQDAVRLELVAVPYEGLADKLTAAIPNGNGPDLFVFAHDRIGDWAEAGLLEPVEYFVDDELADRFAHDAIAALAYQGSLYGLPLAVKSVALFYRTDRVSAPPRTTDELWRVGRELTEAGAGRYALVYENDTLYGHAAWLHGHGGRVFSDDGALAVASAEATAALAFARRLGGPGGIVPPEVDGTVVATLFNEGRAAMAISGPWFIADLRPGVPWAVTSLPVVSATGQPAAPFLGVEAVSMSSRVRDGGAAFAVMAALTGDGAAAARARAARQVVPNHAAYREPDVGSDPVLAAFRDQLAHSVPMPATPDMRLVWSPYQRALERVLVSGADPGDALAAAEREIAGYLAGRP